MLGRALGLKFCSVVSELSERIFTRGSSSSSSSSVYTIDDKRGPAVRPFEGDGTEVLMVSVATDGTMSRFLAFFLAFSLDLGGWLIVASPILLELATGEFSSMIPSARSASVTRSAQSGEKTISG